MEPDVERIPPDNPQHSAVDAPKDKPDLRAEFTALLATHDELLERVADAEAQVAFLTRQQILTTLALTIIAVGVWRLGKSVGNPQ